MNKKIVTLFLLLILIAIGSYAVEFHNDQSAQAHPKQASITVLDGTNHTVRLMKPATRIVSMTGSDSELLLKLGVNPVGVVTSKDLPENVQKELSKLNNIGSAAGPSMERILQARPDLVIGVAMVFQTQLGKAIQQNGIPTYYHIAHSYKDIMQQIKDIGVLTGKTKEANALVDKYNNHLAALQEKNKTKKKTRIIIVFGTPVSYQLATSNTYVGDIFRQLGAINVADPYMQGQKKTSDEIRKESPMDSMMEGFIPLNLETMSILHADKVFIVMHGSKEGAAEAFKKAFRSPAWKNIPAIRDGHVYVLPGENFSTVPTARMDKVLDYGEEILYGK